MEKQKLPPGCDFLPGIAKVLKCGYSTLRRLQKKPGFPNCEGTAMAENKRVAEYYSIQKVKEFKAKCNEAGRLLPRDKTNLVWIESAKFDKFYSGRRNKQTRLASKKIVPRRVVIAPDHWGLRE